MTYSNSPIYRQAFVQYLRKGTPVEISLKAATETTERHSTPLYIWHTQNDGKVRGSHAANEGKVFAWAHPPATGNPGEDFGCRCWAEPVEVDTTPLDIALLLAGAGLVRRVGMRVGAEIIRRVWRREEVTEKPVELPKPEGIPKHWEKVPARKGEEGVKYVDPKNPRHTYVRISRGNPSSSMPGQRVDYVRWQKQGRVLDKNGNVVPAQSLESHIPLKDFVFKPELFQ